jgi:hypothetical protein
VFCSNVFNLTVPRDSTFTISHYQLRKLEQRLSISTQKRIARINNIFSTASSAAPFRNRKNQPRDAKRLDLPRTTYLGLLTCLRSTSSTILDISPAYLISLLQLIIHRIRAVLIQHLAMRRALRAVNREDVHAAHAVRDAIDLLVNPLQTARAFELREVTHGSPA